VEWYGGQEHATAAVRHLNHTVSGDVHDREASGLSRKGGMLMGRRFIR
jgi:hypothetical protein